MVYGVDEPLPEIPYIRTPVAMTMLLLPNRGPCPVVVCDDGSVWQGMGRGEWEETAPIPGSMRALELDTAGGPEPVP